MRCTENLRAIPYTNGISITCRAHMSQYHMGQDGIQRIEKNYNGTERINSKRIVATPQHRVKISMSALAGPKRKWCN